MVGMHRVGSAGSTANAVRPKREPRLTYVLRDSDDSKHCSIVNCLIACPSSAQSREAKDVLFSGSRDGTLKRWEVTNGKATCCSTFESHTDWVNDAVLTGDTLVSCSSDSTIKTWRAFSDGVCTKTLRQHSDYVLSLAAAKHSNAVASAGLGGEIFVWDLEAADIPVVKAANNVGDVFRNEGNNGLTRTPAQMANEEGCTGHSDSTDAQGFTPVIVKGHKESVYAVAMNDTGTVLVSGGTEKAVRVWDPRSGTKTIKLKGHTENIRALAVDDSGRFCLSGSSDSMIRLWDLGQQRCIHSYAVHTDSVWALAPSPSFNRVYSGGRDFSVYTTDLTSRESLLVCSGQHPVLSLALESEDWLWVATSESSICKWPTQPKSNVEGASSFVAGTLPFARARACLESPPPVPFNTEPPDCLIPVTPGIVKHTVLNDRRHILTKDSAGIVKLWEITRGAVVAEFGEVSFEDKEKELFEMVSVPGWFTTDTRLGCLSVHLDTQQCFSAEIYAVDVQVPGASEELKINLGQETLRGLFSHWSACRQKRVMTASLDNGVSANSCDTVNGDGSGLSSNGIHTTEESYSLSSSPAFNFSKSYPPSMITEGSKGVWRRKMTDLDGTEDERDIPAWCLDCLLHGKYTSKENTKCSFYLHPYEGTTVQVLTQGKLTAPRILRIQKVITYVLEKMVLDKALDEGSNAVLGSTENNSNQFHTVNGKVFRSGTRAWQVKTKFKVEILCNQQVLQPEMSLATVRHYIWKKPDDLYLYFRVTPES